MMLLLLMVCAILNIQISAGQSVCNDTSVRLVGDETNTTGRLEVCYNGQWNTVCAEYLFENDARVVCNQLGYPNSYSNTFIYGEYGFGSDKNLVLENNEFPYCNGNEDNLFSCKMFSRREDTTDCKYDFALSCTPQAEATINGSRCVEGKVRLTNGSSDSEGNVEICYDGYWGAVCENTFGIFDGRVVCRQLGYRDDVVEVYPGIQSTLGFWFSQVHCSGLEENLLDCERRFGHEINCQGTRNEVGVRCFSEKVPNSVCDDGSIRLVNGSSENEGVLEVCYLGTWGGVCLSQFGKTDASVICKQLGFFSNGTDTVYSDVNYDGSSVLLSSVECIGNETSLFQCTSVLGNRTCDTNQTVSVVCANVTGECETGAIRLANPQSSNGRVEVCFLNQWGTVCSDQFNQVDALVACRQLGFTLNDVEFTNIIIQVVDPSLLSKKIWLSELYCFGEEHSLFDCPQFSQIGENTCVHNDDVIITCYGKKCDSSKDVIELLDNGLSTVLGSQPNDNIPTSVTLTCETTLAYDTQLKWSWDYKGNVLSTDDHYEIQTSAGTNSSLVIHNLRLADSGKYFCSAHYPGKFNTTLQTKWQKLILTVHISIVSDALYFTDTQGSTITLTCEVSGYIPGDIEWMRKGGIPVTPIAGKYHIVTSNGAKNNSIDLSGNITTSIISSLTISNLYKDDSGTYECITNGEVNSINITYTKYSSTTATSVTTTIIATTTALSSSTGVVNPPTSTPPTLISQSPSITSQPSDTVNTASVGNSSTTTIAVAIVVLLIVVGSLIIVITAATIIIYRIKTKRNNGTKTKSGGDAGHPNNDYVDNGKINNDASIGGALELKYLHPYKDDEDDSTGLRHRLCNAMSETLTRCSILPKNLKLLEKIGQGEFGIVYRGVLKNSENDSPIPVAIKTLRGLYSEVQIDQLLDEAEKMKMFNDLHVLTLTGVCVGLLESPCIVMPFMSNGSLLSYLRKEAPNLTVPESIEESIRRDTSRELLSMCLQVAKGMAYLSKHKFVHRDLAARNCMISADGVIKVADFGLTEDVYTTEYFKLDRSSDTSVKLPLKWMALESIHYGKFTEKTDVWSYGILCWEVFNGGKTPYPGLTPKQVVKMLDMGERLEKPLNAACQEEIYSLMLSCWNAAPNKRPRFKDLVEKVNALLTPLANYMDLNECSAAANSLRIKSFLSSTTSESSNIYY